MTTLEVKNFAQIEHAKIEFGDLTVLVGPQATGKSLLLQWFKFAIDRSEIVRALSEAGHDVRERASLLDLTFGEGMSKGWRSDTQIRFNNREIQLGERVRTPKDTGGGRVFFIPAHRALLLSEGWPQSFQRLNLDTPVVARLFSQNLYQRFSGRKDKSLFPVPRILKAQYRDLIDEAIFHGGEVQLEKESLRYSIRLVFNDETRLPFMAWTSGQREFAPLLLGLYQVLPGSQRRKLPDIDWVVVEEPEMGLHPKAIAVFMLLVLDLLWRGYKVVLSTHSPFVLDVVWALQRVAENKGNVQHLAKAFGVSGPNIGEVLENALKAKYRTFYLDFHATNRTITSRDISALDPWSENEAEATWGGLTGFSSNFGEAVRRAANEGRPPS